MDTELIAHIREKDGATQSLTAHLNGVSKLSRQFAEKIQLQEAGELIGKLHDFGKASQQFQNYLRSATGLLNPDADEYVDYLAKKGKIDHSTAGAQVIYQYLSASKEGLIAAQILALSVASHHSGLIDCLTPPGENNFIRRIEKSNELTHVEEAQSRIDQTLLAEIYGLLERKTLTQSLLEKLKSLRRAPDDRDSLSFKTSLLVRFLFSCLIDADRLDTADFETPSNLRIRNYGQYQPWETLIERLNKKLGEFDNKASKNEVDEIRSQVSEACLDFSTKPKGIYQLTVPTGGGKTWASMRFALHHALEHKMERIFYVIPYTSIIDQNADEIRKALEDKDSRGKYLDKVVLEHHSNLTPEEESYRQSLLSQNWDAPIVFTTQVQFLEALFGSGTRSARRMHQLANSVIIFDEVQTIPVRCVHMFNVALRFLTEDCGVTVVLCTATQPLLDEVDPTSRALPIGPEQKMMPNEDELFRKLKRVEVHDARKTGGWQDEDIAKLAETELHKSGSVLIITNTKRSARTLYKTLAAKKLAKTYHLSTNMCPAHRLETLAEIKAGLIEREPIVCVSTQLIEAGVDIDFGAVIRYLAGLDSIAQAAGRCNRNGARSEKGNVWVVNPVAENTDSLIDISVGIRITERLLDEFKENPRQFDLDRIGKKAMDRFYLYYFYRRKREMGYPVSASSVVGRDDNLFNLLSQNTVSVKNHISLKELHPTPPLRQTFSSAAKAFQVIETLTQGVVVQYGTEGRKLVAQLCGAYELDNQHKLLKQAQRFSVNLFPNEFKELLEAGAIREVQEQSGVYYLDEQYYSDEFGWSAELNSPQDVLLV